MAGTGKSVMGVTCVGGWEGEHQHVDLEFLSPALSYLLSLVLQEGPSLGLTKTLVVQPRQLNHTVNTVHLPTERETDIERLFHR